MRRTTLYYYFFSFLLLTNCSPDGLNKYNLVPEDHDPNIAKFIPSLHHTVLPSAVDLRDTLKNAFPPVFNQGKINACTANAIAAVLYYDMVKQHWQEPIIPSRLFIYYNERKLEGELDDPKYGTHGAPVKLRNGIKTVHKQGFCSESLWPYDRSKVNTEPPLEVYSAAKEHHGYKSEKLKANLSHLKSCLAEGYPFVFGFSVFESFESALVRQTGKMPMPKDGEKKLGGHAMVAVGYDDMKQSFLFRNSFGHNWGDQGYGYIPYEFMEKYGHDSWVIRKAQ